MSLPRFRQLLVFLKQYATAAQPHAAVVACSPQRSGAGCADGFAAKQSPTTLREL